MKKLYYDIKKCLGCRSCEIACAVAHSESKELFGIFREKELSLPRKKIAAKGKENYPLSCRHCAEPKCVDACMAAALTYDAKEKFVSYDQSRCVGCWMCVMSCPYGAIRPDLKTKLALRCDKCKDKESPACATACPTHAVLWQEEA